MRKSAVENEINIVITTGAKTESVKFKTMNEMRT